MSTTNRHFISFLSSCLLILIGMLAMNSVTWHAHATLLNHHVYITYLGAKPEPFTISKAVHSSLLQRALGLSEAEAFGRIVHSYTKSFNAFASELSDEEAIKLSGMDEAVSVFRSKQRHIQTTRSWDFLGFPLTAPRASFESDVIVGMIDTGIWPESKSFDDSGFGPPPTRWKGVCDSNHNFTCNKKIIGARYYHLNGPIGVGEIASPRDNEGHGTHTSSTAAGRVVANASLSGIALGNARGGVPSARISVYKVCWTEGCSDADILAAFDDAIADGVDIISISIGGGGGADYFEDTIAIGSFHAMKKNIITSSSAGNSGPTSYSVENYAPWLLTVAASTIDRKIVAQTKLGDGQQYQGLAINTVGLKDVMYPLIYGGDAPLPGINPIASSRCGQGTLDDKLVKGKVVFCRGFSSGSDVLLAGAVGAIMEEGGLDDVAFGFKLPVGVLGSNGSTNVFNYVNKTSHPTASISKSEGVFDPAAPSVASFSSRGPNPVTSNILKPDLAAPGVDILAAWSPISKENPGADYNIISGTSMACPHATGTAAYVKSFNPTWSSAAIKSALITTAIVMSSTKNAKAEFAYGAGEINPLAASNPGLVYDAGETDYIKMLCGEGYSTKNLRLITGDNSTCTSATNGTVLDLNYPSFALLVIQGKSFSNSFKRTVTNVGKPISTYKATISAPPGIKISVEPSTLSFETLLEKKSFLVMIEGDAEQTILSSSLVWSDDVHNVRSPIVVYTE